MAKKGVHLNVYRLPDGIWRCDIKVNRTNAGEGLMVSGTSSEDDRVMGFGFSDIVHGLSAAGKALSKARGIAQAIVSNPIVATAFPTYALPAMAALKALEEAEKHGILGEVQRNLSDPALKKVATELHEMANGHRTAMSGGGTCLCDDRRGHHAPLALAGYDASHPSPIAATPTYQHHGGHPPFAPGYGPGHPAFVPGYGPGYHPSPGYNVGPGYHPPLAPGYPPSRFLPGYGPGYPRQAFRPGYPPAPGYPRVPSSPRVPGYPPISYPPAPGYPGYPPTAFTPPHHHHHHHHRPFPAPTPSPPGFPAPVFPGYPAVPAGAVVRDHRSSGPTLPGGLPSPLALLNPLAALPFLSGAYGGYARSAWGRSPLQYGHRRSPFNQQRRPYAQSAPQPDDEPPPPFGLSPPTGPFGLPLGNPHPFGAYVREQLARGVMADPLERDKLARMWEYQRRMARR